MSSAMFLVQFIALSVFSLLAFGEETNHYFLTAAKSVPRIGRSANKGGNSDFEKFFLKASKSVPRIGRGNEGPYAIDQGMWDSALKYPNNWNDIAYFYEYQPELFSSDDLHTIFQQPLGDDPSVYGIENARYKRDIPKRFSFAARK